jgi:RNA polymerase sigma-70 factor (ECF subfamily)
METIAPEVLGRLFDALSPALRLYVRQWCDGVAADDMVQEAFLSLARQSAVPDQVSAWLHRVVRNAAISAARSRNRRRKREALVSESEALFSSVDDRLDAQHATRLLAELEPDCREAIVARIWGGLTFDQIAALQSSSLTSVHRRYREGLSKLQSRLERPCSTRT